MDRPSESAVDRALRWHDGTVLAREVRVLRAELERLRAQLAEYRRLQTLGGPPPATDKTWANADLPEVETASDPSAPRLRR